MALSDRLASAVGYCYRRHPVVGFADAPAAAAFLAASVGAAAYFDFAAYSGSDFYFDSGFAAYSVAAYLVAYSDSGFYFDFVAYSDVGAASPVVEGVVHLQCVPLAENAPVFERLACLQAFQ